MRYTLLALLAKEAAHGYDLKRAVDTLYGPAAPPLNSGQVYTTLSRLERDGLVTGTEVAQGSRPNKRVYSLTPAGFDAVVEWVSATWDGPRLREDLLAKLVLAPRAGLADRAMLIDRQRRDWLRAMHEFSEMSRDTAIDGDPGSALLVEAAILHLKADLDWLDRCEEALG